MPQTADRFNLSDVFISYSRRDTEFVKRLGEMFKTHEMEVWVDYEDIAPSVDWWEEIQVGIEGASSFVFVISPDSVASEICRQEITTALNSGKRFIPILHRDINLADAGSAIHPAISSHNWLYFRDTDEFESAFERLLGTIKTDFDHSRQHTRLLVRAREWEARAWDNSALLTGSELNEAEEWLLLAANKEPKATELHARFINSSLRFRNRQRFLWTAGIAVAVIFAVLALALFFARNEAVNQTVIAQSARQAAEVAANESQQFALSSSMVASAQIAYEKRDSYAALGFALAANQIRQLPIAEMTLSDIAYQPGAMRWLNSQVGYIEEIAASPTEGIAVSASRDDTLVIWEIETGIALHVLTGHSSDVKTVAFSPNGEFIASGGLDGRVILWNADGSGRRELLSQANPIVRLAYTPDGNSLAIILRTERDSVRYFELALYDVRSATILRTVPAQTTAMTSLVFSPDGTKILIGYLDGHIEEWQSASPDLLEGEIERPSRVFARHTNVITSLVFSPDGTKFLSTSYDMSIGVWEYTSGMFLWRLSQHTDSVMGAGWLSDTEIFSAGRDRSTILWNAPLSLATHIMSAHGSTPTALVMSGDRRRAITGDASGHLVVWDVVADELIQHYGQSDTRIEAVSEHPSEEFAVAARGDTLEFWDLRNNILLMRVEAAHINEIYDVQYTPDGRFVLSAGGDCLVKVWDAQSFELLHTLGAGCLHTPEEIGHTAAIYDIDISPDGTQVLSGSQDSDIILWDIVTGEMVQAYPDLNGTLRILAVAFANDGTTAIASSNNNLFRFNLETGVIVQSYIGHAESIVSIAISPDGDHFAASDVKRLIIIWEIETGEESMILTGHRAPVWSVNYDVTGTRLVSAADDGSVYIWELRGGDILRRYEGFATVIRSVEFNSDNNRILLGENALIRIELLAREDLLSWVESSRLYLALTCKQLAPLAPFIVNPLCDDEDSQALLEGDNRGELYFDSESSWTFSATEGEVINLIVRGDYTLGGFMPELPLTLERRLDTSMYLYSANGDTLAFSNDEGTVALHTNSAILNFAVPADGDYRVEVESFGGLTRGAYTLTFERVVASE